MKKLLLTILLLAPSLAFAAPYYTFQRSILPIDSTENIGTSTSAWDEGWFNEICLGADCRTGWTVGGSTSTNPFMATYFVATSTTATSTFHSGATFATSGGNVGIGTVTPIAKLHISDSVASGVRTLNSNGNILFRGDGVILWGVSGNQGLLSWDTGKAILASASGNNLSLAAGGVSSEKMVITTGGLVGIGSSTPWKEVGIEGTGEVNLEIHTTSTAGSRGAFLDLVNDNNGGSDPAGDIRFYARTNNQVAGIGAVTGSNGSSAALTFSNNATTGNAERARWSASIGGLYLQGTTTSLQTVSGFHLVGAASPKFLFDGTNSSFISLNPGTASNNTALYFDNRGIFTIEPQPYANRGNNTGTSPIAVFDGVNTRAGIATSTPSARFAVKGASTGTGSIFAIADSSDVDRLRMFDNGQLTLGFGTSANVGIGTTTPTAKVEINQTAVATALYVEGSVSGTTIAHFTRRSGAVADVKINGNGGEPQIVLGLGANNDKYAFGYDAGPAGFHIVDGASLALGTSRFIIRDSTGNVGIGNNNPSEKLNVQGTISGQIINATSTVATSTFSGGANLAVSAGNVGIGLTNPSGKLHVFESGAGMLNGLVIQKSDGTTGNQATIDFAMTTVTHTAGSPNGARIGVIRQGAAAASDFYVSTNNTSGTLVERFRATNTGEFGIGSSTPSAKLSVTGAGITTGRLLALSDSANVEKITVLDNGNLGFSTSTDLLGKLNLFGTGGTAAAIGFVINETTTTNCPIGNGTTGYYGYICSNTGGGSNHGLRIHHDETLVARRVLDISNASGIFATFDGNARLGLGTSSPAARLAVQGAGASTNPNVEITDSTGTPKLIIRDNGTLFMGTTTPFSADSITLYGTTVNGGRLTRFSSGGGLPTFKFNDNSAAAGLILENTQAGTNFGTGIFFNLGYSGTQTVYGTPVAGARIDALQRTAGWNSTASTQDSFLRFQVAIDGVLTEAMRVGDGASTGTTNVGIGTTTPYAKLSVVGETVALNFTATSTTATSTFSGPIALGSAGTSPTVGNATLVAGTVTVTTGAATANSYVILTRKTSGGTIGNAITYTVTNGSFTITSDSALDTSTFTWLVVN